MKGTNRDHGEQQREKECDIVGEGYLTTRVSPLRQRSLLLVDRSGGGTLGSASGDATVRSLQSAVVFRGGHFNLELLVQNDGYFEFLQ